MCKKEVRVEAPWRATRCQSCPPRYLDQLEVALLAAELAGERTEADALAETLDRATEPLSVPLAAAVAYGRRGWPVFPLRVGRKEPATRNGFHDATTDENRIRKYWDRVPTANIGLATGHMFDVIDIDLRKPDTVWKWADITELPNLEVDALVLTPNGIHAYVLPTGDNNSSLGIGGVDFRGKGGYVVAPPSERVDGIYTWWSVPSPRIRK